MRNEENERIYACALNRIFGYEPRIAGKLITELGSAEAVFHLTPKEKFEIFGPSSKYRDQISLKSFDEAAVELESLSRQGLRFIGKTEEAFPKLLLECEDCPSGLYYRSVSPPAEIFNTRPCISVVGTRDISPYGREWDAKIVGALASARTRPAIVSGLAFGVDVCAHLTALDCGLPTVAVLPVGINDVYPKSHWKVAGRIAATPGCALVTDYPPGTPPAALNFLRRNRIIAGLSRATILVESKKSGGGTMTARLASGYGREVFALGGRIDDSRSEGCNLLIGEKIADPIYSLAALAEAAGLGAFNRRKTKDLLEEIDAFYSAKESPEMTARLHSIAQLIRRNRGISLDELCVEAGFSYSETTHLTGILESDGFIYIDLLQRCAVVTKTA